MLGAATTRRLGRDAVSATALQPMPIRKPTPEDLTRIADSFGMKLSAAQIADFKAIIDPMMATYDRLDQLAEPTLEVKYPDRKNWQPSEQENPYGGWAWRCEVRGAASGPLAGKTVALKDNICCAGMPMMCGSNLLRGFVPDFDATLVTRILEAGGTILGKAVCESLCFAGNSHTSDSGIVRNPYDLARTPGGSSTGCGALVAAGSVDLAIGADQAGSVRCPASWSGIVGLKPTYGLVPYTGMGPMELTFDHAGPMARTAADVALLLDVIAGPDGLDPRQPGNLVAGKYREALTGKVRGMRVGIVKEGFGLTGVPTSEPEVDDAVREAAHALTRLGCEVGELSLPWHRDGFHVWSAIACEGILGFMFEGGGSGRHWKGAYPTALIETFDRAMHTKADQLSVSAKAFAMLGRYIHETTYGHYYAKAQNLSRLLVAAHDEALTRFDVLVMPTEAMVAPLIPPPNASLEEQLLRAVENIVNTAPTNISGHPALSVPCAMSRGLPVGMMMIGRRGEDATILRLADAFQREIFTPPPPPALA